MKTRLGKLDTIANHYGLTLESAKENETESKKIYVEVEHLQKHKRII